SVEAGSVEDKSTKVLRSCDYHWCASVVKQGIKRGDREQTVGYREGTCLVKLAILNNGLDPAVVFDLMTH
ncbi:hypothetical protein PISMIDRAFT_688799, partial [Pisolithus microcarpus 441]